MSTTTQAGGGGRHRSLWKGPALVTALVLLIPLYGNRFVKGWNWAPGGFIVLGVLVFGFGLAYQLFTRNSNAIAYRAAFVIALVTTFVLMWGNVVQFVDANRDAALYFATPFVAAVGAAVVRLEPNGMARALFATAIIQAFIVVVAMTLLIARNPQFSSWTAPQWRGFVGNGVDALLFAVSALLFRKAGRRAGGPVTSSATI